MRSSCVLERLHERGMIEARGETPGRVYHLAATPYRRLGQVPGYVRSCGFDRIQRRQMVLNAVDAAGRITRKKTAELCQISNDQASRIGKYSPNLVESQVASVTFPGFFGLLALMLHSFGEYLPPPSE